MAHFPVRSRTHELEDISINKFSNLIPVKWVFTPTGKKEYGIDGEVEIFGESGEAQGIKFLVQLKSSDNQTSKIFKEPIRIATLNYWKSHSLPVLICKYSTYQDKMYYVWAHELSVPETNKKKKSESMTVTFSSSNFITEKDCSKIRLDVDSFRSCLKTLNFPIKIKVSIDDKHKDKDELIYKFSKYYSFIPEVILVSENEVSEIEIQISKSQVCVNLGGKLSTYKMSLSSTIKEYVGDFSAMMVSVLLDYTGLTSAKLFNKSKIFIDSKNADIPQELIFQLMNILLKDGNVEILSFLYEKSLKESDGIESFLYYCKIKNYPYEDKEFQKKINKNIFDLRVDSLKNKHKDLATEYYSFANSLMSYAEYKEAISFYSQAKKHRKDYMLKPYFLAEIGTCLFELKKYKSAQYFYKKAELLESDSGMKNFHKLRGADCYYKNGDFNLALDEFKSCGRNYNTNESNELYWLLKSSIYCEIMENQVYYKKISSKLSSLVNDSSYWIQEGMNYFNNKEYEESFVCCSWAGILDSKSNKGIEIAVLAAVLSKKIEVMVYLKSLINQGIEDLGDVFIESLEDILIKDIGADPAKVSQIMLEILKEKNTITKNNRFTIRLLHKNGSYRILNF